MTRGRQQYIAEAWPIVRHTEEFHKKGNSDKCIFIAPEIYTDMQRHLDISVPNADPPINAKGIDPIRKGVIKLKLIFFEIIKFIEFPVTTIILQINAIKGKI